MNKTMAAERFRVNIFDMIISIARVVDMMSPAVGNHHMQVAYLASRIGEELNLSGKEMYELVIAGALHDIGAFSLQERLDLLEFEDAQPGQHSLAGYLLLRDLNLLMPIAKLIKFHHVRWENGKGVLEDGEHVPQGSHIIHLADRVAVKISKDKPVLSQVSDICKAISQGKGDVFNPDHVDAMLTLSKRDYIWLDVISNSIESILWRTISHQIKELDIEELRDFAWLICRLIDFKSEFTATHSSGVAATAAAVSELVGFSDHENKLMEVAAYLHDLGKLAIPSEILEKPGKLSDDEWFIMKSHVYYTYQMLDPISVLGIISSWGALHQERLNGTGYPFGYTREELPFGSRILAVADVFTALTEDRPYRKGMDKKETVDVLQSMSAKGELDENLINLIIENFDEMNIIRDSAQKKAIREYQEFQASLDQSKFSRTNSTEGTKWHL